MRWWSVFALLLVVPLGACGDLSHDEPPNCTLIGCNDGVHVDVRAPGDAWLAGDYTVEISAGGDSTTCTATLPNPSLWTTEGTTLKCDRTALSGYLSRSQDCDDERDAGAAGGVTCGSLQLEVPGTPSSLQVRIDRDGETILDESTKPKYRERQPNGPGCEPICERSSVEWTLVE